MFRKQSEIKSENIIVVGLGPAGLAASIEACRSDSHKHKVIAFMNRNKYTRDQIFRLDPDVMPYLASLVGQEAIDKLKKEKQLGVLSDAVGKQYSVIKIKTLEEVLFNKLKEYKDQIEVIYNESGSENDIQRINKSKRSIHLASGRNIKFKYILAADGAHDPMSDLLNSPSPKIEYDKTQQPMIHQAHVIANFKLPEGSTADDYEKLLEKQAKLFNPDLLNLYTFGWEHRSSPETRIFVIDDTFYIGAECPSGLSLEPRALEIWIREVLKSYLPESAITKLKIVDPKINLAKFSVELDEAECTILPISPKVADKKDDEFMHQHCSYFFNIGDALRKPHYHTGSGAVFALKQCEALGKFFKSEQSVDDLSTYHCDVAYLREQNRERVDKHLLDRRLREDEFVHGAADRPSRIHGF